MLIIRTSIWSGKQHKMEVPVTSEEVQAYLDGALVQVAFPHLTPAQREFIVSGMTEEEWREMLQGKG